MTSPVEVIIVPDTAHHILESLTFADLFRFAQTNHTSRDMVKAVLRVRYKTLLGGYIDEKLDDFRELMLRWKAVIAGSAAIWVLLSPCDWRPKDINIIVPYGALKPFVDYFESILYTQSGGKIEDDSTRFIHNVTILHRISDDKHINIVESADDSVFPPVISSANSSQMNILTPDEILCLYPTLTLSHHSLVGTTASAGGTNSMKVASPLVQLGSSKSLKKSCGMGCPGLYRRVHDLHGGMIFNWSEFGDEGHIKKMAKGSHLKWRLQGMCHNRLCGFSLRRYKGKRL